MTKCHKTKLKKGEQFDLLFFLTLFISIQSSNMYKLLPCIFLQIKGNMRNLIIPISHFKGTWGLSGSWMGTQNLSLYMEAAYPHIVIEYSR